MYITRHIDPDCRAIYEAHDTYGEAESYARETVEEEGGEVAIFRLLQTVWPREEAPYMPRYNGVRPGVDFPATL